MVSHTGICRTLQPSHQHRAELWHLAGSVLRCLAAAGVGAHDGPGELQSSFASATCLAAVCVPKNFTAEFMHKDTSHCTQVWRDVTVKGFWLSVVRFCLTSKFLWA